MRRKKSLSTKKGKPQSYESEQFKRFIKPHSCTSCKKKYFNYSYQRTSCRTYTHSIVRIIIVIYFVQRMLAALWFSWERCGCEDKNV